MIFFSVVLQLSIDVEIKLTHRKKNSCHSSVKRTDLFWQFIYTNWHSIIIKENHIQTLNRYTNSWRFICTTDKYKYLNRFHLFQRIKVNTSCRLAESEAKSLWMIFTYRTAHTPLKSQGYQVVRNEERKKYIQPNILHL